ncbi:MAG: D-alanine--D-alanine ligase [Oceanicaulis sp.]|jgi:D-alanine-D-alanine ligase|uniref:D-alanine--D-alanine ligase n=1 Tax=unclassified Oceanicaulis TaxID=2632123 RepID=UPI000066D3BC|nr:MULTISPECIES: D-alanine--D-alanine ligase [unclassified Oceanicaulis]EAP91587.1 D-alanine--D-alanine ligase B [Oceanicaulis sp. HTCC2633]MAB70010.1 D-alanine--D-alanine ligase [Oceanicaulis sp.]MBC39762.1 D-alanine--D-alanine ligase [Oceanicaulis sp.]MBG36071.1 D-alanine--D-alanine ligase [Oceanicaulis sp.]HBU61466.1 D-alanine--D-alanine ligase [Oceanicaulis sp.]|tara:strand:- start:3007 stop:3921 length:915 start_codon:yes stop_codon:yes gene_type:complete
MSKHVAVLLGGRSPERDVSLVSGRKVIEALEAKGYQVSPIDPRDHDWIDQLDGVKPDVVFNALHGDWGEDGRVQGVLDYLGYPYTHSGVAASALAMDKQRAKAVLREAGIQCPEGQLISRFEAARDHVMKPPYVAKPNAQGSSVGVVIVPEGANRPPAILGSEDWPYDEEVLIERFIPGRELTVAVMGDKPLTVTEIVPKTAFYDYDAKYSDGGSVHQLPADVPQAVFDECMAEALKAHQVLGCRGLTRSDFRYDPETGGVWLLEINTQPGMTPTSLAPEQAAHCGIGFPDLVAWMVENAACPN